MVLARSPGSIDAILYKVVSGLTREQVFDATGRWPEYFCHAANPDRRERLAVDDAISLDAACRLADKPALLVRAQQEHLDARAPIPMIDLNTTARKVIIEIGELNRAIDMAAEDNHTSPNEARQIAKEAQDGIDLLMSIRDAMIGNSSVRDVVSG